MFGGLSRFLEVKKAAKQAGIARRSPSAYSGVTNRACFTVRVEPCGAGVRFWGASYPM